MRPRRRRRYRDNGNGSSEGSPPKGRIDWGVASLEAETLFFNEQFLHVVRK